MFMYCVSYVYVLCIICLCIVYHMFMYCVSYVYVLCIICLCIVYHMFMYCVSCLCIVYHMFMYCVSYVYVLCIICFSEDRKTVAEVLLFDETFRVQTDSRDLKIISDIQNR